MNFSAYDVVKRTRRKRGAHNRLLSLIERARAPGSGYCFHCRRPWRVGSVGVEEHLTPHRSGGGGCFPLCQGCWEELGSAAARLPYYRALWEIWQATGGTEETWEELQAAVYLEAGEPLYDDDPYAEPEPETAPLGPRSRPSGLAGARASSRG